MAERANTEAPTTQTLAADLGTAGLCAAVALMERRSRAVSDYWRSLAAVREPADLPALQYAYLTQMAEDYTAAISACFAPLTATGTQVAAKRAPVETARAA